MFCLTQHCIDHLNLSIQSVENSETHVGQTGMNSEIKIFGWEFQRTFLIQFGKKVLLYLINLEWLSYAQHMAGTASMHQPPSSTPAAPTPVAPHNCQNLPQPPWTDLSIKLERPDGHSNSVNNSSGNSSSNNSITGSTDPAQEDRGGTTLQLLKRVFCESFSYKIAIFRIYVKS